MLMSTLLKSLFDELRIQYVRLLFKLIELTAIRVGGTYGMSQHG